MARRRIAPKAKEKVEEPKQPAPVPEVKLTEGQKMILLKTEVAFKDFRSDLEYLVPDNDLRPAALAALADAKKLFDAATKKGNAILRGEKV